MNYVWGVKISLKVNFKVENLTEMLEQQLDARKLERAETVPLAVSS